MSGALRIGILLLFVLEACGCSAGASSSEFVILSPADGSRWVEPDHVVLYRCSAGILLCDVNGRMSKRRCRCAD